MSQATDTPNRITSTEEPLYEVIAGRKVELSPMGAREVLMASTLTQILGNYAREQRLGHVVSEMLFRLGPDGPQRRPDVAFVAFARWPRGRVIPPGDAWDVVPDLAVEVVSPSNTADEVMDKIRDFFAAGVRRVWVVFPRQSQVYVYDSPLTPRVVGPDGTLEGEEIIPGFRLPLAELLEDAGGPDA